VVDIFFSYSSIMAATKMGYRTSAIDALQGRDLTNTTALVTGGNSGIVRADYTIM
jgi:hypothetical protein